MKSGITKVCARLVCVVVAVNAGVPVSRLDVPRGFTASVYVRGIDGARDLDVRPDGTLTLQGRASDDRFEIAPPTEDQPLTVMRVAAELDAAHAADSSALAVEAPRLVRMRWNAASGELNYVVTPDDGARLPVATRTLALALAREFSRRPDAAVAIGPDGSLFVADPRAGAVWRVRPARL